MIFCPGADLGMSCIQFKLINSLCSRVPLFSQWNVVTATPQNHRKQSLLRCGLLAASCCLVIWLTVEGTCVFVNSSFMCVACWRMGKCGSRTPRWLQFRSQPTTIITVIHFIHQSSISTDRVKTYFWFAAGSADIFYHSSNNNCCALVESNIVFGEKCFDFLNPEEFAAWINTIKICVRNLLRIWSSGKR